MSCLRVLLLRKGSLVAHTYACWAKVARKTHPGLWIWEYGGWGVLYRSISEGPGQGSRLGNGLAIAIAAIPGLSRLTLAGASHFCGELRSVNTESATLASVRRD
jgi:hypothetical protein